MMRVAGRRLKADHAVVNDGGMRGSGREFLTASGGIRERSGSSRDLKSRVYPYTVCRAILVIRMDKDGPRVKDERIRFIDYLAAAAEREVHHQHLLNSAVARREIARCLPNNVNTRKRARIIQTHEIAELTPDGAQMKGLRIRHRRWCCQEARHKCSSSSADAD